MAQSKKEEHRRAVPAESSERVTLASVPISSRVAVASLQVEVAWLDRLVIAACEMPITSGEDAVVEFLVHVLGEIFPDCGVGACFVPTPPGGAHGARPRQARLFKHVPEEREGRAGGVDPTRLFPGFSFERVLEVEEGSITLHLASDDPQIEADGSPVMHVLRRGALAMRKGLGFARMHARATSDARELRVLSSHMVQAEKLASLGQLAAGIVHELNNPLTSIVAYTDWLIRKQGPSGDRDSLERLRRIGESSTRILRFTRDLVAYARPSSEVPVPVAIHDVIEQALAFCEHVIAEHGAYVERTLAAELPTVRGMPEQLAQVFVNLFTNACHAMPVAGGRLSISSALSPEGRVVVSVEDNGHGIAAEHLASIFTPFFTTKSDGRGTGLGLSIVRNIMDNHGAEICAERLAGGGTRFVLHFHRA